MNLRLHNHSGNRSNFLRVNYKQAYEALLSDCWNSNIMSNINETICGDPKTNYSITHNHLMSLMNKHLPCKLVKFDKYRHKGNQRITAGFLWSIEYRYWLSENKYGWKVTYHSSRRKESKSNMKQTWSVISEMICKPKYHTKVVKAIILDGKQLKDPQSIAERLNHFFVNIGPSPHIECPSYTEENITNLLD